MKKLVLCMTAGALLAGAGCNDLERSRQVDNPAVAGKTIALQVCSNCHGMTGASTSPTFPKLAGQTHEYLVAQLTDFKSHARSDPNAKRFMWGFTHLTDVQIEQLAGYFSAQPVELGEPADPMVMSQGEAIFLHGLPDKGVTACVTCHGEHAEGKGDYPRLAGQHADYIVRQLEVFRSTEDRPRGALMKAVCANMTEQEMQAVASYVEAFPRANEALPPPPPAEQ